MANAAQLDGSVFIRNESETIQLRRLTRWFLILGLAGISILAVLGWTMRANQAGWINVGSLRFYQLLTMHGIGMVAFAHILSMSALWFLLGRIIPVSIRLMWANFWLCLVAAYLLALSVLVGGFAGALTFHYPLPFYSVAQWESWSVLLFFVSLCVLSIPFMLFFLDVIAAGMRQFGRLSYLLGWPILFSRWWAFPNTPYVPPIVIGSTIASFIGILALIAGNALVGTYVIKLIDPTLLLDPLIAKNLLFFWMHNITNVTLFLSVNVIFGVLPILAKRPMKTIWMVPLGWHLTFLFSVPAFGHHILMDVPIPLAIKASIFAQVITYFGMLPAYVITIFSTCMIMYKVGIKLRPAFIFLLIGILGWGIGCFGGLIDATISANFYLHNTLWVPGHFHTYYIFGVLFIVAGFIYSMAEHTDNSVVLRGTVAYSLLLIGAIGLISMFYVSGLAGVPRRFAITPNWGVTFSELASYLSPLIIIGLVIVLRDCWSIMRPNS